MQKYTLEQAHAYETEHSASIASEHRPAYHLTPKVGWMNDPNGFCFYNGQYHMFYQYHPYSNNWGPMHWGHAVSHDLLHWEYLPVALAPDTDYDNFGCFSGSAITLPNGKHLLMYTGVKRITASDGAVTDYQNQCIATGDGLTYQKFENNPVIDGAELPSEFSRLDFRDPKIWQEPDGSFRCVVATRTEDESGAILIFSSPDGFQWHYENILDRSNNELGRMWECPDFFPLGDNYALMVNPQDMTAVGTEFHNGNNTACILGSYDPKTFSFQRESICAVDYGLDFYASQTTKAPDGRRIMIAWMQNWDSCGGQPVDQQWNGQLIVPRELSLKNGKLIQVPVHEINALRSNKISYSGELLKGETMLDGIRGRILDLTVTIRPTSLNSYQLFRIKLAMDDQHYVSLSYRPQHSVLHLSREHSGANRDFNHKRKCHVRNRNGELKLRILLDRFSAEIFVNDGEQALSTVFYTPQTADTISFMANGEVILDVEKYDLTM